VVAVVEDMTVQQEEGIQEDQVVEARVIYVQQELLELVVKETQVVMVYTHKVVEVVVELVQLVQMVHHLIQVEQVEQV
tara:strand:+ start:243 stop:476 length:234 start_codon:yes stop_codon:yes gene_type:complete